MAWCSCHVQQQLHVLRRIGLVRAVRASNGSEREQPVHSERPSYVQLDVRRRLLWDAGVALVHVLGIVDELPDQLHGVQLAVPTCQWCFRDSEHIGAAVLVQCRVLHGQWHVYDAALLQHEWCDGVAALMYRVRWQRVLVQRPSSPAMPRRLLRPRRGDTAVSRHLQRHVH